MLVGKNMFGGKHRNPNFYHVFRVGTNFYFKKNPLAWPRVQNWHRLKMRLDYRNIAKKKILVIKTLIL